MHNVQKEIISLAKKHGLQLKEDTLLIRRLLLAENERAYY